MLRHQQKDEEAGGEGLGIVSTRKRMWKDADGNIVTKRPKPTQCSNAPNNRLDSLDPDNQNIQPQVYEPPASPPPSLTSAEARTQDDFSCFVAPEDLQMGFDLPPLMDTGHEAIDFFGDSPWATQQTLLDSADGNIGVDFDDLFNPDTGMDVYF